MSIVLWVSLLFEFLVIFEFLLESDVFIVWTPCFNIMQFGHVYKFLRSQRFDSSYDIANKYIDSYADAHKVNYLTFSLVDKIVRMLCFQIIKSTRLTDFYFPWIFIFLNLQ